MNTVKDALGKLDPKNDNHWTEDGLPRMDTIKLLAGNPGLTREAVTSAAPDFTRETAQAASTPDSAQTGTPVPPAPGAAPAAPVAAATVQDEAPPLPPESDLPQLNAPPLVLLGDDSELHARIEQAKLHLSDRQDNLQLAKQELDDAQNAVADLEALLKEDPVNGANPITEYLKRQQQNLIERGARKELIKDSGLDLKQLSKDLKSPLDASMERRTGRGGVRPVRS